MTIKTGADLIAEAKNRIREISIDETKALIGTVGAPVILDCREPQETNLGRIPGSLVIPRGTLETKIEAAVPRNAFVVIVCASGNRSALAADTLQQMGYHNVASMAGGFNGWAMSGGAVES